MKHDWQQAVVVDKSATLDNDNIALTSSTALQYTAASGEDPSAEPLGTFTSTLTSRGWRLMLNQLNELSSDLCHISDLPNRCRTFLPGSQLPRLPAKLSVEFDVCVEGRSQQWPDLFLSSAAVYTRHAEPPALHWLTDRGWNSRASYGTTLSCSLPRLMCRTRSCTLKTVKGRRLKTMCRNHGTTFLGS